MVLPLFVHHVVSPKVIPDSKYSNNYSHYYNPHPHPNPSITVRTIPPEDTILFLQPLFRLYSTILPGRAVQQLILLLIKPLLTIPTHFNVFTMKGSNIVSSTPSGT